MKRYLLGGKLRRVRIKDSDKHKKKKSKFQLILWKKNIYSVSYFETS